ncbi:hypothetical protein N9O24_00400 [bacterium]|nr:hypothetical protein [bacterium]
MHYDSILEIPKAPASDEIMINEPYVADLYEVLCALYQRDTGTPELIARAKVARCFSSNAVDKNPGKLNDGTLDSDTATVDAEGGVASTRCCLAVLKARMPHSLRTESSSDIIPATDSIVGWSKRSVCGSSVENHSVSVFANSVAAIEFSPAAISGEFVATAVPSTHKRDDEMLSAAANAPWMTIDHQGATSIQIYFLGISSHEIESPPSISREPAIKRSDG